MGGEAASPGERPYTTFRDAILDQGVKAARAPAFGASMLCGALAERNEGGCPAALKRTRIRLNTRWILFSYNRCVDPM